MHITSSVRVTRLCQVGPWPKLAGPQLTRALCGMKMCPRALEPPKNTSTKILAPTPSTGHGPPCNGRSTLLVEEGAKFYAPRRVPAPNHPPPRPLGGVSGCLKTAGKSDGDRKVAQEPQLGSTKCGRWT